MERFLLFIVGLFFAIIWVSYVVSNDENDKAEIRRNYLATLTENRKQILSDIENDSLKKNEIRDNGEYILGKFLIVDRTSDGATFYPDSIIWLDSVDSLGDKAVKTLIVLDIEETEVGQYNNGAKAIRPDIKISFVKYPGYMIYHQKKILGSDPPSSINRKLGDKLEGRGYIPSRNEVLIYLKNVRTSFK